MKDDEADDRLDASIRGVEQALEAQKDALHHFEQHVRTQLAPQTLERAETAETANRKLREALVTLTETWLHKSADAARFQSATARALTAAYAECADDLLELLASR